MPNHTLRPSQIFNHTIIGPFTAGDLGPSDHNMIGDRRPVVAELSSALAALRPEVKDPFETSYAEGIAKLTRSDADIERITQLICQVARLTEDKSLARYEIAFLTGEVERLKAEVMRLHDRLGRAAIPQGDPAKPGFPGSALRSSAGAVGPMQPWK